jgi:serine/threonine protein phosphatase PrpC
MSLSQHPGGAGSGSDGAANANASLHNIITRLASNSAGMHEAAAVDSFRLTDLNPMYGGEVSYTKGPDHVRLVAVILPCEDLVIDDQVEVEFTFPLNYPVKGGMQVSTPTPEVFRNTAVYVAGSRQLVVHGFESARYPIGVWYFTLRIMLRKECDPWITPFEICRALPVNSRQLDGGNVQRIEMIAGAGRTRGRRSYMEDVDYIFDNIRVSERVSIASFGVLDGHGGAECAKFAVDDIPMKIAANLRSGMAYNEALFKAFLGTDAEFLKVGRSTAGSTACVMLWDRHQGNCYFANTGDTRAVLSRSGKAFDLTRDKKATDPAEIARICLGGGFVINGRVLGSLAVSRALGDGQLKQPGKRTVIPDPDVTAFRPNAASTLQSSGNISMEVDEFIIIATDGLWDVLTSQQAVNFVRDQLDKAGLMPDGNGATDMKLVGSEAVSGALSQIADLLANHAVKNLASLDNVTVMIIRVLIGEPGAEVPVSGRLEGWQWEAQGKGNSKKPDITGTVFSEVLGKSMESCSGKSSGINGSTHSNASTSSGNSKVLLEDADNLDFLYNDPVFAASPGKKDLSQQKTKASLVGQSSNNAYIQSEPKLANGGAAKVSKKETIKQSDVDMDNSDLEFLLDDSNF